MGPAALGRSRGGHNGGTTHLRMARTMNKTWFAIDGSLEPIDYVGPSFFRFPLELAKCVVTDYSAPGDWVLDPFCGFGTTLVAAQQLGRKAIGFEKDADRGHFAARACGTPEPRHHR